MITGNMINSIESKPFIRVGDNHLIPVHRITEIDFIENGIIYLVGEFVHYDEESARVFEPEFEVVEEKTSILTIKYLGDKGITALVRRTGKVASGLWEILTTFMSIP